MNLTFIDLLSGDGGFADVWRARDELERDLAVKIVREASVGISNALDHARALARARHPNVVIVHAIEKVKDPSGSGLVDAVVMELLVGETLGARLDGAPLSAGELAVVGKGILDAIQHIHEQKMVHGDLHENNVMISNGEAKIIDLLHRYTFGTADALKYEDQRGREARALRMLLQQILNHSDVDAARCNAFTGEVRSDLSISRLRLAFENAVSGHAPSRLRLEYERTPLNLFDLVVPGMFREHVRTLLGPPHFAFEHRWRYRYQETQVEVCFTKTDSVDAVVVVLCAGKKYHGNHPTAHTDRPLGELTLADVLGLEGNAQDIEFFESGRTQEVYVRGRWGPTGAWSYYACGALMVFTGVGYLAETSFEWDIERNSLKSEPNQVVINWMASTSSYSDLPPGFDWFIKG